MTKIRLNQVQQMTSSFKKILSKQIVKFSLVGGLCLGFNTILLICLVELLNINGIIATVIGFFLSNLLGFFLNKYYTFCSLGKQLWQELIKYYTVMTSSFLMTIILVTIFVYLFKIWVVYGNLLTAVIMYIYNYIMHKNWSFKFKHNFKFKKN
jgi:putative flippase GtrA